MFDNLKNTVDFFLRNKIRFSRQNYSESSESKSDLQLSKDEEELEKILVDKYKIKPVTTAQDDLKAILTCK